MKDVDIVEFVEKHCGVKLLDCQKDMLRTYLSKDQNVALIYPRHTGYSCYRRLSEAVKAYLFDEVRSNDNFR